MLPSIRMVPALIVALLAGSIRAAQLYLPRLATRQRMQASDLSILVPVIGLLALAVSPFGAVIVGYIWGTRADVRNRWKPFLLGTIVAAFVGFIGTSLLLVLLISLLAGAPEFGALARQVTYSLVSGLGLVSVGLVALAGGAIAEFRFSSADGGGTAEA